MELPQAIVTVETSSKQDSAVHKSIRKETSSAPSRTYCRRLLITDMITQVSISNYACIASCSSAILTCPCKRGNDQHEVGRDLCDVRLLDHYPT